MVLGPTQSTPENETQLVQPILEGYTSETNTQTKAQTALHEAVFT